MNERIQEAFQLLQMIQQRTNDLDSNISRALTMAGAFAGLISISVKFTRWQETLFIYFDVASIVMFLVALHARKNLAREVNTFFYYENIAKKTEQEFLNGFDSLNPQTYLKELQQEIYYASLICADKERWFNWGLVALTGSLFCWIAVNIWSIF